MTPIEAKQLKENTLFVGILHSELKCTKRILGRGNGSVCGKPLVFHPKLKFYWLCTNRKCPNYHICSCGLEFGRHYEMV